MKKQIKVAIFYDWLNQWGGAERVLLDIIKIFPQARVLTLVYDKEKCGWLPKGVLVETSFLDKWPGARRNPLFYTPFYSMAVESLNTKDYDLLISTTSTVGHGFITATKTLFVCYLHNVNRYIYQTPKKYRWLSALLMAYRKLDYVLGQRPDNLFCNSVNVKRRIEKAYGREAKVIYPGVDTEKFIPGKKAGDYFLITGRLVPHKRVDIAIEACGKLGVRLVIAGDGREREKLEKMSRKYQGLVEFLGWVSEEKLVSLYQECRGLICPQEEDFGLTPLEVQACGRGVVALAKGGVMETVVNNVTGVFFQEQESSQLIEAIKKYLNLNIKVNICRRNAVRFSNKGFMLNLRKEIDNLCQNQDQY